MSFVHAGICFQFNFLLHFIFLFLVYNMFVIWIRLFLIFGVLYFQNPFLAVLLGNYFPFQFVQSVCLKLLDPSAYVYICKSSCWHAISLGICFACFARKIHGLYELSNLWGPQNLINFVLKLKV